MLTKNYVSRSRMLKLLPLTLFLITIFQCKENDISGKVVKVADGDTFTLLTSQNKEIKVRLHGIDAPERGQDFHRVSKDYLTGLVMHQSVRVIVHNRDRYGRTVGTVVRGDHIVNELMLQSGLAWHYIAYDKNEKWSRIEASARHEKRGLWSLPSPVAPWEFRRQKKIKRKD